MTHNIIISAALSGSELSDAQRNIVTSFRALCRGNATEGQQKAAMDYIMNDLCHFNSPQIFAGGDAQTTAFNMGKRQVWAEIAAIMSINK